MLYFIKKINMIYRNFFYLISKFKLFDEYFLILFYIIFLISVNELNSLKKRKLCCELIEI